MSSPVRVRRVNWIVVALLLIVAAIFGLILTAGESPTTATVVFMNALGKGDVKTLADRSYFNPERSRDDIIKDWTKSIELGKYYRFIWKVDSDTRPTPDRATVKMTVMRDVDKGNAYDEPFSLDLIRQNGKWLVDVRSISRQLYPALPR